MGSWKTNIEGGLPKKGWAWAVYQFKGGAWQERGGGVFEGGGEWVDTPMHTVDMWNSNLNVFKFTVIHNYSRSGQHINFITDT